MYDLKLYQWLVPALAIFYIVRTIRQYTKGKYSPRNTIIWITFWVSVALLGIMPNEIANSLAEGLGFRDRPNAIIFVALGALFLMVFYLSAALNRVENQLTDLVRGLALSEVLHESALSDELKVDLQDIKPASQNTAATEKVSTSLVTNQANNRPKQKSKPKSKR